MAKLIFSLVLGLAGICMAEVIYVDAGSPNDPGTGTAGDPYRWIQDAIDNANHDDTIEIQTGIYTGTDNYNLDPAGLAVTIRSTDPNDPGIVAATIIDPGQAGRGFYLHSGEGPKCVIAGITIRNGFTGASGAGIYCDGSSPTVINCIIKDNSADYYGGGIYCKNNSNAQIIGCIIKGNQAGDGGGLECESSNVELINCLIYDNHASHHGGGVDGYDHGDTNLVNCTVVKNSSEDIGGAFCLRGSAAIVKNSIFWANEATYQASNQMALLYLGSTSQGSSASVSYSNVQGGQSGISIDSNCNLIWDSESNIDVDPNFASFDPGGDADLWDFHLKSTAGRWDPGIQDWVSDSTTSPCIDTGDPTCDWSGEPWPNGKRINMGAYGGVIQASMNGNPGDFDISGNVNLGDFSDLAGKWMLGQSCIEDLDNSGGVSIDDLTIFAENWLWQKE